jgi:uncharacterized OB-fold protein
MSELELRPDRTLGPGHDEFWAWCAKGELRLQRCAECGRISWPVVPACEFCGHSRLIWTAMSGSARLVSWCTFERDYYKGIMPIPYDTILVELDDGALFLSNPKSLTRQEIAVDMPLKLAFLDCRDTAGPFRLPVFEPA